MGALVRNPFHMDRTFAIFLTQTVDVACEIGEATRYLLNYYERQSMQGGLICPINNWNLTSKSKIG